MLSTLLAPTEAVTSSLEVKRALLTYDTVYIPHPEDREFFPKKALFPMMFPEMQMMGIPEPHRPSLRRRVCPRYLE